MNESGGLIILAMYIAGLSIDDAIRTFANLAKKAFTPQAVSIPFLSSTSCLSDIKKFVISYLADSLYPSEGLESRLKQVFGKKTTMFDCSYATRIGAKIVIPVTTIPDCSPCLFINYRREGKRPGKILHSRISTVSTQLTNSLSYNSASGRTQ